MDRQIQACVDAIRQHADYASARRVVHSVSRLNQRNVAELEIRVDTAVYAADDRDAVREYHASCVTQSRGELVRFHFSPSAN